MSSKLFGDYGMSIPALLDYYFWAHENGIAIQWFTPGFCGGIPVFPEPQSSQYSVLTAFTYIWGPTSGVKATFLFHAWIGFIGSYLLCRRSFQAKPEVSLIAAALFMFNGFYAYRIVVSHLFFGLMYTPLQTWLLAESFSAQSRRHAGLAAMQSALLFAIYIYGGGLGMVVPYCAGVALLLALWLGVHRPTPQFKSLLWGVTLFVLFSLALCAPKLIAASTFLGHFPRDSYRLPGFSSFTQLITALWSMFFASPKDTTGSIAAGLVNSQWLLERHEWEFGVTLVPLLLLIVPLRNSQGLRMAVFRIGWRWWIWALCAGLALAPVALNYYTPGWNLWLKQIPVFKSSSNLVRYFWILLVFLCFFPAIFFDRLSDISPYWRNPLLGLCLLIIPFTFATQGKDYYARGSTFDPGMVESKYAEIATGRSSPAITELDVLRDKQGNIIGPPDRNKTLAGGISQLLCYQPIFGYRLEAFPFGYLHPGSPNEVVAPNRLNFKNPACMVYPEANNCSLGEEFHVDQADSLEEFLHYSDFPFVLSPRQQLANAIALLTLVGVGLYTLACLVLAARRKGM